MSSPLFAQKMEEYYGLTDMSLLMVDIWSAGNYGAEEESELRLARPLVFLRSDPTDNGYVRPLEGLRPVVDLNTMTVLRVEEYTSNGQARMTSPHLSLPSPYASFASVSVYTFSLCSTPLSPSRLVISTRARCLVYERRQEKNTRAYLLRPSCVKQNKTRGLDQR